ncbi:hypothetical protein SLE2022_285320 [Rubroshorea leprosula]
MTKVGRCHSTVVILLRRVSAEMNGRLAASWCVSGKVVGRAVGAQPRVSCYLASNLKSIAWILLLWLSGANAVQKNVDEMHLD